MLKGNRICFGYGDVLVGHNYLHEGLHLTIIEPPQKIGHCPIKKDVKVLQEIDLKVENCHLDSIREIKEGKLMEFKIGDYILDFSHFNPKSVGIIENHIDQALNGDLIIRAC